MKRFIGLLLSIAGGGATLLGGILVLTGRSEKRFPITDDFAPTALVIGLAGIAVLTVGLMWNRD